MLNSILITYVLLTAPFVAILVLKVVKKLTDKKAIGTVSTLDAVQMLDKKIGDEMSALSKSNMDYFSNISYKNNKILEDIHALLFSTKAMTEAMIEIRKSAVQMSTDVKPTPVKNIESFVNSLSYVRDKFTDTPEQKKVVDTIISNIKTTHGSKTK